MSKIKIRVKSREPYGLPNTYYNRTFMVEEIESGQINIFGERVSEIYYTLNYDGYCRIKKDDCEILPVTNKIGGIVNERRLERSTDRS